MSRMFVVLAVACLTGFGACGSADAESAVKGGKSNAGEKQKGGGQGQSTKPTSDNGSTSGGGGRTDSEYGQSGPKGP